MKVCIFLLLVALTPTSSLFGQSRAVDYVHPLVGTANEGQTYPATGVPFAMTHWTPQTRAGEIKCVAPYYFADTMIQGFRGSHFLSGSCVPDYGSVTLMPSLGALKTSAVDRASHFARASERATPYSYKVDLADAGVLAEITGTTRSGMMRFTAQHEGDGSIVIENNARGGDGWVRVDHKAQEVTGEVPVRREYAGSGKLAGFSSYFVVEFSRSFTAEGAWSGVNIRKGIAEQHGDGLPLGVLPVAKVATTTGGAAKAAASLPTVSTRPGFGTYVRFPAMRAGETIVVRIGTSFVSVDEARKNLRAEIADWNFDAVEARAKAAWESELSRIEVKDDIPARDVFYTALYHALLHPRTFSDVDGSYPRFAGKGEVEHAGGFVYYDDFSMWDTFRAQHPMLTILDPDREVDMVRSLILKGQQGGYLPIFPAWNSYTSEMVGDHSSVTIIDAYKKGLRGFDIDAAYSLIRKNAVSVPSPEEGKDGKGRRGLDSYLKLGYIPLEDHIPEAFHKDEQISRTLEYAYDDAMIGTLAAALGKMDDARLFQRRGQNWRKVLNPTTGFARGRYKDGTWTTPSDPASKQSWITEGLPWQYTFFVPQDVPGLIESEGGDKAFTAKLDRLFDGGFYDHGNEPSHHIAYLYDASGASGKTQQHVRALMDSEYKDAPDGLAGNDDAGQMSAWYVLSALGFYQVTPGVPEYWFGSPRFDDVTVLLPTGKRLHIAAKGAGEGRKYVTQILLNGRSVNGYKISYFDLVSGGEIIFEMAASRD
ncbi:putative alpha-1,2-mannosidase [Granulicella aggregans]|uniref:Putative alpha-1,2-mannosidase n=1 Tax=Granulicella aggregans TaxID=474949 RepID=A0A7W7ZGI5_9BACT|nr:GH92 family glycosyl hydrolase [Granulicella aggregans]MBB5059323.1 putative alpha-1,2-mannosidase [Granulicella aggregans]